MIDLHVHTLHTDGLLTTQALVDFMAHRGFRKIVITDHDSLAPQRECRTLCRAKGIDWMSGLEINSRYMPNKRAKADDQGGDNVHILGYGFELEALEACSEFARHAEENKKFADDRGRTSVDLAEKYPVSFTFDGKEHQLSITHEAFTLFTHGLSIQPGLVLSYVVNAVSDLTGFSLSLNEAKRLFYSQDLSKLEKEGHHLEITAKTRKWAAQKGNDVFAEIEQAIAWIAEAGGKAVIAHPGECKRPLEDADYEYLADCGARGLEVYSPKNAGKVDEFCGIADKFSLIKTGGSDWHGRSNELDSLGFYERGMPIPVECWDAIAMA